MFKRFNNFLLEVVGQEVDVEKLFVARTTCGTRTQVVAQSRAGCCGDGHSAQRLLHSMSNVVGLLLVSACKRGKPIPQALLLRGHDLFWVIGDAGGRPGSCVDSALRCVRRCPGLRSLG